MEIKFLQFEGVKFAEFGPRGLETNRRCHIRMIRDSGRERSLSKICLIGTSLATMLLARRLANDGFLVTVFEKRDFGGAWQRKPIGGVLAPVFNNILWASSKKKSPSMSQLKSALAEVGINLEQHSLGENDRFVHQRDVLTGDFWPIEVPESGNLSGFWGAEIVRQSADHVKILPSPSSVEESLFDAVVISRLSQLRSIELVSGNVLRPRYEHFHSRHLRVLLREKPQSLRCFFSQEFDGAFDRWGFSTEHERVFIGRVAREFKSESEGELIRRSRTLEPLQATISHVESNFYEQARMSTLDWNTFRHDSKRKPVFAFDHQDLFGSIEMSEKLFKDLRKLRDSKSHTKVRVSSDLQRPLT